MLRKLKSLAMLLALVIMAAGCGGGGGGGGTTTPPPNNPPPTPDTTQTTTISGMVLDRNGAPVSGATVSVQEPGAITRQVMARQLALGKSFDASEEGYSITALVNAEMAKAKNGDATFLAKTNTVQLMGTTTAAGAFSFENVKYDTGAKFLITVQKDGIATFQSIVSPVASGVTPISARVANVDAVLPAQAASAPLDAVVAGLPDKTGMNLSIPGGSVLDANGNAVTGNIKIEVTAANPAVDADRDIFPGTYVAANINESPLNAQTSLESVAFAEITIKDAATGKEYTQLDPAKPATVEILLPDQFQTEYVADPATSTYIPYDTDTSDHVRSTVPWWSYNEDTAQWQREDADPSTPSVVDDAKVVLAGGKLYAQGKVVHFTWWNGDYPMTRGYIDITVRDADGNPIKGVNVEAKGTTYNSNSGKGVTDANGVVRLIVKQSTGGSAESVEIIAHYMGNDFTLAGGPFTTPSNTTPISINTPIVVALDGKITGQIKNSSGVALPNIWVYTDKGMATKTNSSGVYSFSVVLDKPFTVLCPNADTPSVTVTCTAAQKTKVADFVIPTANPDELFNLMMNDMQKAHKVLSAMESMGTLDDRARFYYAFATMVMAFNDAATPGHPLNGMVDSLGLVPVWEVDSNDTAKITPRMYSIGDQCNNWGYDMNMNWVCTEPNPYYDPTFNGPISIPAPQASLEALQARVEKAKQILGGLSSNVNFTSPPDMGSLQVDNSDGLAVKTMLDMATMMLEYFQAYDLTYQNRPQTPANEWFGIANLQDMSKSPDAAGHLANAKAALKSAIAKATATIASVKSETDPQYDDLIYIDAQSMANMDKVLASLAALDSALTTGGAVSLPIYDIGNSVVTAASFDAEGFLNISEQGDLFKGYLRIAPANLFDETKIFVGADMTADIDDSLMTIGTYNQHNYLVFDSTGKVAGKIKALLPDSSLVTKSKYYGYWNYLPYPPYSEWISTKAYDYTAVQVPFRNSAGVPQLENGRPVGLSETISGGVKPFFDSKVNWSGKHASKLESWSNNYWGDYYSGFMNGNAVLVPLKNASESGSNGWSRTITIDKDQIVVVFPGTANETSYSGCIRETMIEIDANGNRSMKRWYKPGVGIVKVEGSSTYQMNEQTETWQLKSFTPGTASSSIYPSHPLIPLRNGAVWNYEIAQGSGEWSETRNSSFTGNFVSEPGRLGYYNVIETLSFAQNPEYSMDNQYTWIINPVDLQEWFQSKF